MRKAHLWISLLAGIGVWGVYFAHCIQSLRRGDTGDLALWFLGALGVIIVVEVVAGGMIGWLFRKRSRELDDGPTLAAALKASHVALMILIAMILVAAASLSIPGLFGRSLVGVSTDVPIIMANGLLAMVVVTELARAAFTLALMPRR